VKRCSA